MKRILISFVIIFLFSQVTESATIYKKAGTTGMSFLKIGVGSRGTAMADAFTAVSGDQTAAYWNPSGIIGIRGKELVLMHNEWFQGISFEYVGFASGSDHHSYGASLSMSSAGNLERREKASLEPLGTFGVYDLALSLAYARRLSTSIAAGATVKVLYEKIDIYDGSGIAFDLGFLYRTPLEGIDIGISARNLGRMNGLRSETISLPVDMRIGALYNHGFRFGSITLTTDVSLPNDNYPTFQSGIEYYIGQYFGLRAGYHTGQEERNITAGFGVKYRSLVFDYSFVPYYFSLGDTHRISLKLHID